MSETVTGAQATPTAPAPVAQEQQVADKMFPESAKADAAKAAPAEAASGEQKSEPATTEQKAAEAPKTDEKKVPEKYDLKLSEDSMLEPWALDEVAAYAKAQGLSQEEAQEIVTKQEAKAAELVEKRKGEWFNELQSDKEIGGAEFKKNAELALRVVERFGTPTLKAALNKTGYGNHPELVRLFTRIGKAMSEDQFVVPGAQSQAKRSIEDVFYPTHNQ